jgi:hypothetical protein
MLDAKEFDWYCVPLIVELKRGSNWAEMEEVEAYSSIKLHNWPIRDKAFT